MTRQENPRRRYIGSALFLSVAIVAVGMIAIWGIVMPFTESVPLIEPPIVDTGDLHSAVADQFRKAREAVAADPESAETWGYYGRSLAAHEQLEAARECFQQAERLDRSDVRWPYLRAVILETSHPLAAVAAFDRAASLDPKAVQPRLNAAEILLDRREFTAVQKRLKETLAVDPQNARGQLLQARLAFERGELLEALQWAADASRQAPEQRAIVELLAQLQHRLGNHQAAAIEVERLREMPVVSPAWPDPYLDEVVRLRRDPLRTSSEAEALLLEGKAKEAIILMRGLVYNFPDSPEYRDQLLRTLIDVNDLNEAELVASDALRYEPKNSDFLYLAGLVAWHQKDLPRAAGYWEATLAAKPDHAAATYYLALCRKEQGETAAAIELLKDALRLEPRFPEARNELEKLLKQFRPSG